MQGENEDDLAHAMITAMSDMGLLESVTDPIRQGHSHIPKLL